MATRARVFIDLPGREERQRLAGEAARAGWIVVESREDADLVLTSATPRPRAASTAIDADERPYEGLTPREREVLALLAEGAGNREIAERLGVTEHTVKFHLGAIFGKLGASTRTEAVRRALRWGWVEV